MSLTVTQRAHTNTYRFNETSKKIKYIKMQLNLVAHRQATCAGTNCHWADFKFYILIP